LGFGFVVAPERCEDYDGVTVKLKRGETITASNLMGGRGHRKLQWKGSPDRAMVEG